MDKNVKKIILSDKDRDKFLEMLKDPSEPNEAMKRAAARYKQMVQDGDLITDTSKNCVTKDKIDYLSHEWMLFWYDTDCYVAEAIDKAIYKYKKEKENKNDID